MGTSIRGTSVFAGDLFVSGALKAKGISGHGGSISGSIHRTQNGLSFIKAGNSVTVTSASNGQITIGFGSGGTVVDATGTPVDNQLAVWTDENTLEGDSNFTWGGTILHISGNLSTGFRTKAQAGSQAHGHYTTASNSYASAQGTKTLAAGQFSHAEGKETWASGENSHAEGEKTHASNQGSHAEGYLTTGSGAWAHAEGANSVASGQASHAAIGPRGERYERSRAVRGRATGLRAVVRHSGGGA